MRLQIAGAGGRFAVAAHAEPILRVRPQIDHRIDHLAAVFGQIQSQLVVPCAQILLTRPVEEAIAAIGECHQPDFGADCGGFHG